MKIFWFFFECFGSGFRATKRAELKLPLGKRKRISKNLLYFQHIKNSGMAYHKLDGKKNVILWITGGLTSVYSFLFLRACRGDKEFKQYGSPLAITVGGAYGNFLERLRKGSVTDFILIDKGSNPPIFNIADARYFWEIMSMGIMSLKDKAKM